MASATREFIKNHPFTSFFAIGGGFLGFLIADSLSLASRIYEGKTSSFSVFDPTGILVQFLFILPITLMVNAVCILIGGVTFAIGGIFLDLKNKKKRIQLEEQIKKNQLGGDALKKDNFEEGSKKSEKQRIDLEQEKLVLARQKLKSEQEELNLKEQQLKLEQEKLWKK